MRLDSKTKSQKRLEREELAMREVQQISGKLKSPMMIRFFSFCDKEVKKSTRALKEFVSGLEGLYIEQIKICLFGRLTFIPS